jgi:MoxR-like ATPase
MAEQQVSIERHIYQLPKPFFVIATQNSVDFHGTYPLPEAQPVESLQACLKFSELQSLQAQVKQVRISEELKCYIVDIVAATRGAEEVKLGASPRASLTLMRCAQAFGFFLNKISPLKSLGR